MLKCCHFVQKMSLIKQQIKCQCHHDEWRISLNSKTFTLYSKSISFLTNFNKSCFHFSFQIRIQLANKSLCMNLISFLRKYAAHLLFYTCSIGMWMNSTKKNYKRYPIFLIWPDLPKAIIFYTLSKANVDWSKNMLLLKNSQFLPNYYEILPK